MTDRELLEYAAKAAGIELRAVEINGIKHYFIGGRVWNPREDSGDAFNLLVKLRLSVQYDDLSAGGFVQVAAPWAAEFSDNAWNEWIGDDPYAATRRAIVRAAAEIGKEKNR